MERLAYKIIYVNEDGDESEILIMLPITELAAMLETYPGASVTPLTKERLVKEIALSSFSTKMKTDVMAAMGESDP